MLRPERPVQHVATLVDDNLMIWQPPVIVARAWRAIEWTIGLATRGCPLGRITGIKLVRR